MTRSDWTNAAFIACVGAVEVALLPARWGWFCGLLVAGALAVMVWDTERST